MSAPETVSMLGLPVAVELTAIVVGALSGAIHAVVRKADAIGTFTVALATSVGGGMLRDVLMGALPPAALQIPRYLPTVAVAALVALLFAPWLSRIASFLAVIDALLVGLWTVAGTEAALARGLPGTAAVFLGTVTASGGGALRDLIVGEPPAIFRKGQLHVTVAIVAAAAHVVVISRVTAFPPWAAQTITVLIATGLRLAAIRWNLTSPDPIDLPGWWRRRRAPP